MVVVAVDLEEGEGVDSVDPSDHSESPVIVMVVVAVEEDLEVDLGITTLAIVEIVEIVETVQTVGTGEIDSQTVGQVELDSEVEPVDSRVGIVNVHHSKRHGPTVMGTEVTEETGAIVETEKNGNTR